MDSMTDEQLIKLALTGGAFEATAAEPTNTSTSQQGIMITMVPDSGPIERPPNDSENVGPENQRPSSAALEPSSLPFSEEQNILDIMFRHQIPDQESPEIDNHEIKLNQELLEHSRLVADPGLTSEPALQGREVLTEMLQPGLIPGSVLHESSVPGTEIDVLELMFRDKQPDTEPQGDNELQETHIEPEPQLLLQPPQQQPSCSGGREIAGELPNEFHNSQPQTQQESMDMLSLMFRHQNHDHDTSGMDLDQDLDDYFSTKEQDFMPGDDMPSEEEEDMEAAGQAAGDLGGRKRPQHQGERRIAHLPANLVDPDGPCAKRLRSNIIDSTAASEALLNELFSDGGEEDLLGEAAAAAAALTPRLLAVDVKGECIPVTSTTSGVRVYCQKNLHSDIVVSLGTLNGIKSHLWQAPKHLLSRPVSELIRELDGQKIAEAIAESERVAHVLQQAALMGLDEDELLDQGGDPEGHIKQQNRLPGSEYSHENDHLWVDKYAPRNFMSLLSDEATNREVAKWVKTWDKAVSNKTRSNTSKAQLMDRGHHQGFDQQQHPEKVVLISGPPGQGKTTLAHVVARHCGYHPYEINASDDRTASTLTQRICDAVQMTAVLGGGKPNCVIIDEIDGATGGAEGSSAIAALLKIVNAGISKRGGDRGSKGIDDDDHEAGAGEAPKGALRPLRDVARVFHFKAPTRDRLVTRLQYICIKEGLKADKQALVALCDRTDCDIRACLNTLQFLAKQKHGHVTMKVIEKLGIGSKDTTRNAVSIWNDLLQVKGRGQSTSAAERVSSLWNNIYTFGDHDLLMSGLFENIHAVRFLDINFKKTSDMVDRLAEADMMLSYARHQSEYGMMQYIPPSFLFCHLTAAQPERPSITWPRAQGEAARKLQATAEMVRSWSSNLSPSVAQAHSRQSMVLELVPAIKVILTPPIRALAAHMLSPGEQQLITGIVQVMLDYALSFDFEVAAAQAVGESASLYRPGGLKPGAPSASIAMIRPIPLKPAVDTLHMFTLSAPGGQSLAAPNLPLVTRQMISQHATQEAIRRADVIRGGGNKENSNQDAIGKSQLSNMVIPLPAKQQRAQVSNRQVKKVSALPSVPIKMNWLDSRRQSGGRKKTNTGKQPGQDVAGEQAQAGEPGDSNGTDVLRPSGNEQFNVLYRFNEGYTNAVKRPLLMNELI